MIELRHISKSFGSCRALEDASLQVRDGERLAIVGENGAGKSTLMSVLAGMYAPDAGELQVDGRTVTLGSPRDALRLGIGMVHQHFMLVPTLSVAQNVVLGMEPTRWGWLDLAAAERSVKETAERYGFPLDPRARVEDLSVGSQQKVELVKALYRGAKTLILDEPTAVLTPAEVDELLEVTRGLQQAGHQVIFIGHKLREVLAFSDRVIVMRRGRVVAEAQSEETTPEQLAGWMLGPGPLDSARGERGGALPLDSARGERGGEAWGERGVNPGALLLQLERASAQGPRGTRALHDISLTLRAGEVVGIAGVDGNGQTELAECIAGLRPLASGTLNLDGRDVTTASVRARRAAGLAHVPEDRHTRAMVGPLSVEENLSLGAQERPPFARGPFIDRAERRRVAHRLITDFDVRPPLPTTAMESLSGGNQQKAVLARELSFTPRVLLAVQPTRGLDIRAVAAIHARLREVRARGAAVLLISLDLEEVLELADRVLVLSRGRISGAFERPHLDARAIGAAMLEGAHG